METKYFVILVAVGMMLTGIFVNEKSIAQHILERLKPERRYKLQIRIRCESGSTVYLNKFYRYEWQAVLAAWIYGPDPKLPWIMTVHTSITKCNG